MYVYPPLQLIILHYTGIGLEEVVVEALDVLQECIEMEQPLVNDHIEVTVMIMNQP